ncbi:long-chain-fatty-acid-CoA ligase [Blumeria hordei DH14]|uniref:Long-chain-fatty-acid-CoA ligase n=1 Tax=Blumeria graminis f. sp. hordei (strain DH14) TaxID=546991 RepID=N1JD35_BLUG1|nr:long-chain-fatty-acid-CoA ligase [Blumeria hordei DH14]
MAPAPTGDAYVRILKTPPPAGTPYSLPVPGSEKENRTPIYRHWQFVDKPLLETLDPKILTVHDSFEASLKKRSSYRCLGSRPWDAASQTFGQFEWMTYGEVAARRENFGKGLVELHRKAGVTTPKYGIGLWCQNRPEWQIADLGCMSQSLYTVSIYDTLGPEATEHIINHAEIVCVISSLVHVPTLLKLAPRIPTLKIIICLDPIDAGERPGNSKADILNAIARDAGITIHSMKEVEQMGAVSGLSMNPPRAEDVITINYTSGTSGIPKGVILTHRNAIAGASCGRVLAESSPSDVVISYLPLAHIYQRVAEQGCFSVGSAIGYFHGDIFKLIEDIKLLRPAGFISVPRLYNRFGSAIRAETTDATGLKGAVARHIINTKLAKLKLPPGQATNKHLFYDYFFAHKLRSAFGLQRAKTMVSGSAPLDPNLHQLLRAAFGNTFIQGYGLTETYAMGTYQHENDLSVGNCGMVAPSMEACLQSVPDMEYLVTDSPNPRETESAILSDGFFRTGDIAEIDSMGRGEYISPERIENVYLGSTNLLTQAYVHGDSTQAFLVCVCGIDPVAFAPFAGKVLNKSIAVTDLDSIKAAARTDQVRRAVIRELDIIGKKNKFNSYERVRSVWLEIEPFSIANDLLTPTLKLKRPQTAKKYRPQIDTMYAEALAEESMKAKL